MKMRRKEVKMNLKPKRKIIILLTLGIVFGLFLFTANLNFNLGISNKFSDYTADSNLNKENLKLSTISGKIHIDNNWTAAKAAGICTGSGSYSDPYVIEDLEVDGGSSRTCILIENSNVFFRIEDCNVYSSGDYPTAGIMLNNTNNGHLIDNVCSPNFSGISLYNSHNNTISRNTANNYNNGYGILLWDCDNNTVSGNIASHNSVGISLHIGGAENNDITGNNLLSNYYGMQIWVGSDNIISRNVISNNSVGIEFMPGAHDNDVYLNCFIENGLNAHDGEWNNRWDNGIKGNYWDNYTGSDTNGDGIGDVPYNIAGPVGSQDNFPLMKCPFPPTQDIGGIPIELIVLISVISGGAVIGVATILLFIRKKKRIE